MTLGNCHLSAVIESIRKQTELIESDKIYSQDELKDWMIKTIILVSSPHLSKASQIYANIIALYTKCD
jgi:hypothetical protein